MRKMGYCGDICDYCPRYIATLNGNEEKLNEIAVLWHRAGVHPTVLSSGEIRCQGCSRDKACPFGIAQCASGRHLRHCGECKDYPCSILQARFDLIPKLSEAWKKVCTKEEYDLVYKAFFEKRENLEKARMEDRERR